MQLQSLSLREHLAKLGGSVLTFELVAMGIGLADAPKSTAHSRVTCTICMRPSAGAWRGLMKQLSPGMKVPRKPEP
jgi:hypothetical protein